MPTMLRLSRSLTHPLNPKAPAQRWPAFPKAPAIALRISRPHQFPEPE